MCRALILITLLLAANTAIWTQKRWKLALNKDGIKVWVPENSNSTVQSFRAEAVIATTPQKLLAVLRQARNYPRWVDQVAAAKIVKVKSSEDFIIWYKIDMPLGFSDRDIVLENKVKKLSDGTIKIQLFSVPNAYPRQHNVLRIRKAYGYWIIKPLPKHRVKIVYEFSADMEMDLPSWLVNSLLVNSPYKTLKNLRQWVKK